MRILTNHQVSKSKGDSKKSKTANTQKTAKKGKSSAHSSPNARIIIGIALMLFAALSSISIFSYTFTHGADILYIGGNADKPANWLGKMGAYLAHGIADYSFGIYAIGLMLILFFVGVKLTFDKEPITLFKSKDSEHPAKGLGLIINTFLTISWLSMFTALFSPNSENFPEGVFGEIITGALVSGTTKFGAVCILIAILFVILILCYNLSPNSVIEFFSKFKKENSDPEGEKVKKHRGFFSFFRKKEDDDEDELPADNAEAVSDLEARYMSLYAEYDNYRKRTQKEKDNLYADAIASVTKDFLTLIDNLDRATEGAKKSDENSLDKVIQGMELVGRQAQDTLKKIGVEEIPAERGTKFDPNLHEAMMHIDDEELGEQEIAMVFAKGYKYKDRVIRHAQVQVAN